MAYGEGDATYQAAGGESGIAELVGHFYRIMQSDYGDLWAMHSQEESVTHDKLVRFLCGWMGGPRRYSEKYGPISIPLVHGHLRVTEVERDQWLACMKEALAAMAYPPALQEYLLTQLAVPAERIRQYSMEKQVNA